jgi:hypothetical protein
LKSFHRRPQDHGLHIAVSVCDLLAQQFRKQLARLGIVFTSQQNFFGFELHRLFKQRQRASPAWTGKRRGALEGLALRRFGLMWPLA